MNRKKGIRKAAILIFWVVLWQLLSLMVDNTILLASPYETLLALGRLLEEVVFLQIIGTSLLRIGGGFVLGLTAGLALAALAFRHGLVEEVLAPMISLMKTVPVASFVVLLLIWWGSAFLSVAICFLMTFPQIYVNTLQGLKSTDPKMLEMAKVFRLPLWNKAFYLYRPALRPFLFSGLKLALGMCWKAGVAAEVIGTPRYSIGEQLYFSKIYLDTSGVFAWTAVVIVLSILFEKLVLFLANVFFQWEPVCLPVRGGEISSVGGRLELQQVEKHYGEQRVLERVSAVYEQGETYLLNSPSGSGKTTLLRILCGLEKADSGTVIRETTSKEAAFSVMFQEDRLCEDYSAVRNVELVLGNRKQAREALEQLLEPEALDKPCSQLSGGMKRRVALVRAMEAEADWVLLDEPFTGMDEDTRSQAKEYMEACRKGRTMILATHI